MRLTRLFIGKYEAIRRPATPVDDALMSRIEKARYELLARGKDVVSVRAVARPLPKTPRYARAVPGVSPTTVDDPVNRAA